MATVYTYDPTTQTWGTTITEDPAQEGQNQDQNPGDDNLGAENPDPSTPEGQSQQESNNIELNILVGNLNFIVTKETIKLKAGDTVRLKGFGKYLSGKYYVKEVNRSISSNGYSHSAVVIKTDFGSTLKSSSSKKSKHGSST